MKYCEETVEKAGALQACGRPLDEQGNCDRQSEHFQYEDMDQV